MQHSASTYDLSIAKGISRVYYPFLEKYYRVKIEGWENLPDTPFLGVGNHNGGVFMPESHIVLSKYHQENHSRPLFALNHAASYQLYKRMGLPVEKLGLLEARKSVALEALQTGGSVLVYPGGDRENHRPFSERNQINFYGHKGYIKLALKAQVPIIPIVGIGGHETIFILNSGEEWAEKLGLKERFKIHSLPFYWAFPFGFQLGFMPFASLPLPAQITIKVLPAFHVKPYPAEAADDPNIVSELDREIRNRMQEALDRMAEGRIPLIGKM